MTVMLFSLYIPGAAQQPSYHVEMKLFIAALLACAVLAASDTPQLRQVQSVYILPMSSGMDQYIASNITRQGLFQVVTDPQRADAILTDRIGESFEKKLDELYPPPKPEKPKKDEKDSKSDEKEDASSDAMISAVPMDHLSSFGRGKGMIFLVDRKSRAVIWSTYNRPHDNRPDTLDKNASHIVNRLKQALNPKESK